MSNEVHLWCIHCASVDAFEISTAKPLSDKEVIRARRFKNIQHGKWWALVHTAVREILSKYTPQSAMEIEFDLGQYGKPVFKNLSVRPLHFSLSHSGENALLAITCFSPLGVDIEKMSNIPDMDSMVRRFFSRKEQDDFWQLHQTKRIQGFYDIWTRKEALIKANGLGLTAPLEAFDVPVNRFSNWATPVLRAPLQQSGSYLLMHLDPALGYTGALCLNFPDKDTFDELKLCTYSY